jgi:hypothetical protein
MSEFREFLQEAKKPGVELFNLVKKVGMGRDGAKYLQNNINKADDKTLTSALNWWKGQSAPGSTEIAHLNDILDRK